MRYHFKSALLISSVIPQDRVPGSGGKGPDIDQRIQDHSIDLSVMDEFAVPVINAVVALAVGWPLTLWAPLTGNPEVQGGLRVFVCIASLLAFWSSRKEHRKFSICTKALSDRQCEWSALRISDGKNAADFEVCQHSGALLDGVHQEDDLRAPVEEYGTQSAAS